MGTLLVIIDLKPTDGIGYQSGLHIATQLFSIVKLL